MDPDPDPLFSPEPGDPKNTGSDRIRIRNTAVLTIKYIHDRSDPKALLINFYLSARTIALQGFLKDSVA